MRTWLEYRVCSSVWIMLLFGASGIAIAQQPEVEIEHLIKAATHLEQAGYDQLAAEVRQLAAGHDESVKQRLLEAKRAQISELQAEVDQLQLSLRSLDGVPKVVFRLEVLHLSMDKLREFGFALVSIRQLLESDSPSSLLDDSGDITQFLDFLVKQGFAEVIATPTLVTTDGQPARFRIAQLKSTVQGAVLAHRYNKTVPRGVPHSVRFECTPTILSGGKIRLRAVFCNTTQRLPAEAGTLDGGADPKLDQPLQPGASKQDTGISGQSSPDDMLVEMARGETLILALPSSAPAAGATQATLVLLQAEVVKSSKK